MEQDLNASSIYPDKAGLSNPRLFRAIVEWDPNLPADLVIYPLGNTAERDEQIRATLQQAFTGLMADHARIQDERPAA